MSSQNLSPISHRELAAQCLVEAKRPGIPVTTSIVLFLASHKLEASADRHVYQAAALEKAEARRA